jgi:hypothetical protein
MPEESGEFDNSMEEKGSPFPKGSESDPVYVEFTKEQEERLIAQFEGLFGDNAERVVGALGAQTEAVVGALGDQTVTIVDALEGQTKEFTDLLNLEFQKTRSAMNSMTQHLGSTIEDLEESIVKGNIDPIVFAEAMEKNSDALEKLEITTHELASASRQQNQLLEAQTPEALRIPVLDKIKGEAHARLQEAIDNNDLPLAKKLDAEFQDIDDEGYRSKVYQREVEDWFEARLRYMETFETSFEEQGDTHQRLVIAETFFRFKDETKPLAEKIHKRMEARRLKQRMVRVWNLSTPENIMQEAGRFNLDVMEELFTYEVDENGKKRNPIADEFHEYELLGMTLEEKRAEYEALSKNNQYSKKGKDLKKEIDDYRFIKDYSRHGGRVGGDKDKREEIKEDTEIEAFVDTVVMDMETKLANKETIDNVLLTMLQKDEGAKVDEVVRHLESKRASGDEDVNEVLLERLNETLWARKTAGGLWSVTFRAASYDTQLNGTGDFFAARVMNLGERLKQKALYRKTEGIWNPKWRKEEDRLFSLGMNDFFSNSLGESKKNLKLHEKKLGSEDFWTGLREKAHDNNQQYASDQIDKFMKADLTRKMLTGSDGFFHNPSVEKYKEMMKVFAHFGEGTAKGPDGKPLKVNGVVLKTTERQYKWQDLLERSLEWMEKDENASELIEDLKIYPGAEKFQWTDEAANIEMINDQQADLLYKKFLNFPFPLFGSPRDKARMRSMASIALAPWKYGRMRTQILLGWLGEFFKRGFGYVFSDEVR